jgi:hypothetical protein
VATAANLANKVSLDGDTMTGALTAPDLALNDAAAGALHQTWTAGATDPANAGTTPAQRRSSSGNTLDIIGGTSGMRVIKNQASGYATNVAIDNSGTITMTGGVLAMTQSATAPAIASSGTITTAATGVSRLAPAAAVTGVIMQAGTIAGQICIVVNESAAASTITMAAAGTSNVADGTSCVIAGLTQKTFVWDSSTSRWYHS